MRSADSGVLGVLWAEDGLPSRAFPQHARQFPSSTNCSISAFSVLISANPSQLRGTGRLIGEFAPCAERPSSLCPPTVSTCFNGDALRCPCLNSTTGRNLTSELEALALSPQGEPSGLISPQTSFFPCKARLRRITARLVEGSLYASASDTMDNTTTVNLARGGHSQLKTSEPSTGRGIRLSLWMVRPIECPRRLW